MQLRPFHIVPFTCAICGAKFGELGGKKCLSCGKLACSYHFWWGWLKGESRTCSICLNASKPDKQDAPEKK